ncbi:MAG: phosphoribosylformylglycinamidine cyclo-ligase [Ktedonobacterales bacterium]
MDTDDEVSALYTTAGVDLDAADSAKLRMREAARSTHGPQVLAGLGGFGGLFAMDTLEINDPVLVSSIDGVGTKLKIAFAMGRHASVGSDLVAHCANDILVYGAHPLFFLDYLALGAMDSDQAVAVVEGVAAGCHEAGCALIGGETASMPGFYAAGEYDLAGCIVGIVEHQNIVTGAAIAAGDVVIGFPSLGLHTNGYSLARYVLGQDHLDRFEPSLGRSIGDELLQPHRNYGPIIQPLLRAGLVTGMVHVTGGGMTGNVPRVVPGELQVVVDAATWDILPVFRLIQERGQVSWPEMVRVFNLGIGYILFCHEPDSTAVLSLASQHRPRVIGYVRERRSQEDPAVIVEGLI